MMDIGELISLVGGGAGAIDGIIKALKGAKDLVKKEPGKTNVDAIDARLSEAYDKAIEIKQAQLSLLQAMLDFKLEKDAFDTRMLKAQDFETTVEDYILKTLAPHSFAYALKDGVRPNEPRHYLCAQCFRNRKASLLQLQKRDFNVDTLKCNECSSTVICENDVKQTPMVGRVRRSSFLDGGWDGL